MIARPSNLSPFGPAAIVLLLVACEAGSPSGTQPKTASPSAISSQAALATAPTLAPTRTISSSSEPATDLGPFSCDSPIADGTKDSFTNIMDVRAGTHPGFDRVVFEFSGAIPEFNLESVKRPFSRDASGLPLVVEGNAFWRLTMHGATKLSPSGGISYTGPTNFEVRYPQLVDLVEGGDFEAVSTWYLGLQANSCVRVLKLSGPGRLVIDIEH